MYDFSLSVYIAHTQATAQWFIDRGTDSYGQPINSAGAYMGGAVKRCKLRYEHNRIPDREIAQVRKFTVGKSRS